MYHKYSAPRGHKWASDPLGLELKTVCAIMWVLEIEHGPLEEQSELLITLVPAGLFSINEHLTVLITENCDL